MTEEPTWSEKLRALGRVARYRPKYTVSIICLSLVTAVLEGIGLSFLLPIIEIARDESAAETAEGPLEIFVSAYELFNVPFTLETVIVGVALVMSARYTGSFLVTWLQTALRVDYVRHLKVEAFSNALETEISYFDQRGSDDILNAIVTQSTLAGDVIRFIVRMAEQGLMGLIYLSVALYLAPRMTIVAAVALGGITYLLREIIEPGYSVGDRVADANERLQEFVQAGMQGIRDVKLFNLSGELFTKFESSADSIADSKIRLRRNEAALNNFYQLFTALAVFGLIYGALKLVSLSLASLGVFLFAMFRLAPRVSSVNNQLYKIEGKLPHLVRTQNFIDELEDRKEPAGGNAPIPDEVGEIEFDRVSFEYQTGETVFEKLSFSFERGDFVAFVGPSGAGKSTIVSLLSRMYRPGSGEIRVDGTPVDRFDLAEWRSRVAVVRQNPFIFNDTLWQNVTIGNRDASRAEVERVCEIAQVTEFLDDLPDGYDSVLGDDGVRLSGGQKQRVALARALLKETDLLVLDEATSDLDTNIEETVHDAIETMGRDAGLLVIAHRLSTVVNADRIHVINDGRIVESGTHETLLENSRLYAELYGTQSVER
jgi:subfamily B ATP-binding cassette protein MsbA